MKSTVFGLLSPTSTTSINALKASKELFRLDSEADKDDACGILYSFLCIKLLILATQSAPLLPSLSFVAVPVPSRGDWH